VAGREEVPAVEVPAPAVEVPARAVGVLAAPGVAGARAVGAAVAVRVGAVVADLAAAKDVRRSRRSSSRR